MSEGLNPPEDGTAELLAEGWTRNEILRAEFLMGWWHRENPGEWTAEHFNPEPPFLMFLHSAREQIEIEQYRTQAAQETTLVFRWIGLLLPKRIRDEEIGDALEDLQRIINDPACKNIRRTVRWKLVSTCFWLLWHAVGRVTASIFGKRAG